MTADINTAFARPLSRDDLSRARDYRETGSEPAATIVVPVPQNAPEPRFWHPTFGKPSSVWSYVDAAGALLGYVARFDPPFGPTAVGVPNRKQFSPYTLWDTGNGLRWKWKGWVGPTPLYGLKGLAENPTAAVVVVEGEKCADAARAVFPRSVVITSPGGAQSARKADWSPIAGRQILIWGDADAGGVDYAQDVAAIAADLGCTDIRTVDAMALVRRRPDGQERDHIGKWDVASALSEGWEPEALRKAAVSCSKSYQAEPAAEPEAAPEVSWEAPDVALLGNGRRAAPVFPLSLLGGYWAEWVERKAKGASGPVDYVATALLASTGAVLANVRWATAGATWSEPPILRGPHLQAERCLRRRMLRKSAGTVTRQG
jgi:hypothetical protein